MPFRTLEPLKDPESSSLSLNVPNLPKPVSYFKGITSLHYEIPNNIIAFSRHKRSSLGEEHHYHHRFVLLVNISGNGSMVLEGHTLTIEPMEALLIFPYQFHHFLSETSENLHWVFITFELNRTESRGIIRDKVVAIDDEICHYLNKFLEDYAVESPGRQREAETAAPFWLGLILSKFQKIKGKEIKQVSSVTPPKLDQIKRYIWDHKNKDIPIKDLSNQFGMSESYLRQLFKKKIGISLGAYILKVRLNLAQSLLLNSNLNVSEIAYKCGYDSVYSFSRAFKKRTGFSPLAYRRTGPVKFNKSNLDKNSPK